MTKRIWTQPARRALFAAITDHPDFGPFNDWPEKWFNPETEFNQKLTAYLRHWAGALGAKSTDAVWMQIKYAVTWRNTLLEDDNMPNVIMCRAAAVEAGLMPLKEIFDDIKK